MICKTIALTVNIEPDTSDPAGYRLLSVRVGSEPTVPLPPDKPAPRRLVQNLVAAALAAKGAA
jgi:hypothetical protein